MDPQRSAIHETVPEVKTRLGELGLSVELLHRCLEHGQYYGDETTANHPRMCRGLYVWGETNRELRDELVPQGWTKDEESNIPRTVDPEGEFCVVAVSGEDGTGIPGSNPGTKNPRGTAGIASVQENRQLELFPERFSHPDRELMRTWYLLYLRRGDTLLAELLLPTEVDGAGTITRWDERIILPTLDLTPGGTAESSDDTEAHKEVDVPVQRRDA